MPPLPLPDPPLADDVLRLRPPAPADVPAITEACQDPEIQRFTFVPSPYTEAHAAGWVADAAPARARGEALEFVIADTPTDVLLGTIAVQRRVLVHRTAEIGYWVAPAARGRGTAARALALLAPWALRSLGLARVTCEIDVDNDASQRVAEAAGFTREGVLRSAIEMKGRRWSLAIHSLIAEDLA
ncbi:MAG: hypothetical protein QOF86_3162 [Baekduia sp.]|nr:hypothetical protein [Baekduia sp.]